MRVIKLEEVDSTNIYAKQNMDDIEDRTIIRALRQTSGRGRLQRKWMDLGSGNVFLSFVLKPSKMFDEKYSNLTQYLSVILAELLEEYGLKPQIKWPNDVLVEGKKIAGILCETVMQGVSFKGLVLGVGINLNVDKPVIDTVVDKPATALNIELGEKIDCDEFIQRLIDKFFTDYDNFLEKGFEFIKSSYVSRIYFLDTEICIRVFDDIKNGVAKYINNSGELVLENNGKEFVLTMGDIL